MAAILARNAATCVRSAHAASAPRQLRPLVTPFTGRTAGNVRKSPRYNSVVVAATNDLKVENLDESQGAPSSNYTAIFALAAFAASYFEQITINVGFLLQGFAYFALINSLASIVYNEGEFDRVGSVIAPGVLATHALSLFDTGTVAIFLLGTYIARDLKGSGDTTIYIGWVASLLAAIYFGYGSLWIVAAYAFGTATRLLDGLEKNAVPMVSVPVLLVSAFAVYKEYKMLWAMCIGVGETVRAFYSLVKGLKDKEPKGLHLKSE